MKHVLKRMGIVTLVLTLVTLPLIRVGAAKEKTLGEYKKELATLEENLKQPLQKNKLVKLIITLIILRQRLNSLIGK